VATDVLTAVRSILSEYVAAKKTYIVTSERCLLKGWPDRKQAIRNSTRLLLLQGEAELMRFDSLAGYQRDIAILCKSLESIIDRLYKHWTEAEDIVLRQNNPSYVELVRQLELADAARDPAALDGPLAAARGDPEYLAAAEAMRMKYFELNERLGNLMAGRSCTATEP
jgi:hypothetical protein